MDRSRQPLVDSSFSSEDSSDEEMEEENEPDLEGYVVDIGRVVRVEMVDKKRCKENWFPGLVVIPSAQPTSHINMKEEYLIRSFRDGRYYTVPKKETKEFSCDVEIVDNHGLLDAIHRTLQYLTNDELPLHWDRSTLFDSQNVDSDSEENFTSSDDEPCEEKDLFVAQLYKFMDDAGTPLNKNPTISSRDIDLHRLFRAVHKLGGYNRVTNQNKWRSVTARLHLPNTKNTFNQVKTLYKKCLLSYESFHRTLGVTMRNHTRSTKKNRGRSLLRDKDRATPVNSPRPDKEEEPIEKKHVVVKEEEPIIQEPKSKKKVVDARKDEEVNKEVAETSDANSSDATDICELVPEPVAGPSRETGRGKRVDKSIKEKKIKASTVEKVKTPVEKPEEPTEKEKEDKTQQTRSKSQSNSSKQKDISPPSAQLHEKKVEPKTPTREPSTSKTQLVKPVKKFSDDDKKRGRKRALVDEKDGHTTTSSTSDSSPNAVANINIGDKLKVYYGPTHESKVTYEAKVIDIEKESSGLVYLVHYTGWNTRYDEWISHIRIAENLSATTKAKRLKQGGGAAAGTSSNSKNTTSGKVPTKRRRGISITGRSTSTTLSITTGAAAEVPRSTTPSSVTSSGSRTKSPATPATRSTSRLTTRQESSKRTRRTSAQTDASNHSESDSDVSESETELTRTRSGVKADEPEVKTYKRKIKPLVIVPKTEKSKEKDDIDVEKEDDVVDKAPKRVKKFKKSPEKSAEESDDETNPPKGRDFDLNQIRSELKGFTKALKVPAVDSTDKDAVSSSDDSVNLPSSDKVPTEEPEENKEKLLEKLSSSEDIYEFKEPEPFEFESRSKLVDEKNIKKRLVPRLFEDLEKSPPKKKIKSPGKSEQQPESGEVEKKRFRRTTPQRKQDDFEEHENPKKDEDPFDKLVGSPSFNLVKTGNEKLAETKAKVVRNILEEPLNLFRELPESADEYPREMVLSDSESQSQHIFSRAGELFPDTFSKPSPDRNTLELEFQLKSDEGKLKDSDDDDLIRAQIERVIRQSSSTDEDSNETLLITPPTTSYQVKKRDEKPVVIVQNEEKDVKKETVIVDVLPLPPPEPDLKKDEPVMEKSAFAIVAKQISPALQETDSSLMESICAQPVLITKLDDAKDLNVKTGTKIADSILQKFNSIKNKIEAKTLKVDVDSEKYEQAPVELQPAVQEVEEIKIEIDVDVKTNIVEPTSPAMEVKKPLEIKAKVDVSPARFQGLGEARKRRKVISKPYILESDSDSSDSEQLVIVRSDEDSQTTSLDNNKLDIKESDSNLSAQIPSTDDSQTQQEQRNFKFDDNSSPKPIQTAVVPDEIKPDDYEPAKEDEPDSQLHSLLLCEETLPRSPAPVCEGPTVVEPKPTKSVLEMPFASAPGTSNSKSILLEHKNVVKIIQPVAVPVVVPVVVERAEINRTVDAAAVLVNTPPTTPESSISNLSPRGENGDLSPNTVDNESCKSNEAELEYPIQRRNSSNKVSPYSEEDTQMTGESSAIIKKSREESTTLSKKRRKSLRGSEDTPSKRGRKPLNRSRHNSDSDDTSEHSNTDNINIAPYERTQRSPRPSKYTFLVEFDPSLDSNQRIAVLQQKLTELRKTYADVKAELACIDRRKKKIKRREREAQKATKQEMVCA